MTLIVCFIYSHVVGVVAVVGDVGLRRSADYNFTKKLSFFFSQQRIAVLTAFLPHH